MVFCFSELGIPSMCPTKWEQFQYSTLVFRGRVPNTEADFKWTINCDADANAIRKVPAYTRKRKPVFRCFLSASFAKGLTVFNNMKRVLVPTWKKKKQKRNSHSRISYGKHVTDSGILMYRRHKIQMRIGHVDKMLVTLCSTDYRFACFLVKLALNQILCWFRLRDFFHF